MRPLPRPEVQLLAEAVHGTPDVTELERRGIPLESLLDFSTNINPFAPQQAARDAVARASLARYPDRDSLLLRRAIARRLGTTPEAVVVGNGSSELLWLAGLAYLRQEDPVLIVGPTFAEYERIATLMGAKVCELNAVAEDGFAIPIPEIERQLGLAAPRVCFVCNPNNPTGQSLSRGTLAAWVDRFPETLFVVDEAYVTPLESDGTAASLRRGNLLALRSLTKAYGLAGLRVGYAIGEPEVIEALCRVRPPWSVNTCAQAAAVAAIEDEEAFQHSRAEWNDARGQLIANMTALGFRVLPSQGPFFLVKVAHATRVRDMLLEQGQLVRDCTSFGLPEYIRISPRRPEENASLLRSLEGLLRSPAGCAVLGL